METTECNEATFPSSGHRDSPPSLLSLGVHAQASSPSPPCTQQHASFPPLPCAPFLQPPLYVSSPSSPCHLSSTITVLHPFLFRLDLNVDPLLKITERWRGLQKNAIVTKQKNHARCHMIQTSIPHHLVNAVLTKCRLKHKIRTHPIPLPICVLFIGLGYLARIAAKAHGHWNTTRQRQWVEGIFDHPAITTIQPILF